jgi:hypothetical protein
MTICDMPWHQAMNAVRAARRGANPNFGFQKQLQNFEFTNMKSVREHIHKIYGVYDNAMDVIHCKALVETYKQSQAAVLDTNGGVDTTSITSQMNSTNKQYPLPFNAYNLDNDDGKKKKSTTEITATTKQQAQISSSSSSNNGEKQQQQEQNTELVNKPQSATNSGGGASPGQYDEATTAAAETAARKESVMNKIFNGVGGGESNNQQLNKK